MDSADRLGKRVEESGQLAHGGGRGTVDLVVNTVSSVFSSVVNLALAFVFSIYLLLSKEKIGDR